MYFGFLKPSEFEGIALEMWFLFIRCISISMPWWHGAHLHPTLWHFYLCHHFKNSFHHVYVICCDVERTTRYVSAV